MSKNKLAGIIVACIIVITVVIVIVIPSLTSAPEPAEFQVSNLHISPEEVESGQTVTITVEVRNVGEERGTHNLELIIDGIVRKSDSLTFDGGETTSMSFFVEKDIEGSYGVELGGLTGTFQVVEPEPTPAEQQYTLREVESLVHTLVNSERTNLGLTPVRTDALLTSLAQEHSRSMALHSFFSHDRRPGVRDLDFNQPPNTIRSENLSSTPQTRFIFGPFLTLEEVCEWAVSGWMNSPAHRNTVLEPRFTKTGVGVSLSDERLYITQIFEGDL